MCFTCLTLNIDMSNKIKNGLLLQVDDDTYQDYSEDMFCTECGEHASPTYDSNGEFSGSHCCGAGSLKGE